MSWVPSIKPEIVRGGAFPDFVGPSLLESGDYVFIDKVTQASNGQTMTISGLSGNTDSEYILHGALLVPTATANIISIQPNGLATNQVAKLTSLFGTAAAKTVWEIANYSAGFTGVPVMMLEFEARIRAAKTLNGTAVYASIYGSSHLIGDLANNESYSYQFHGLWDETSTEITSLVINSSVATGILADSEVKIYKPTVGFTA